MSIYMKIKISYINSLNFLKYKIMNEDDYKHQPMESQRTEIIDQEQTEGYSTADHTNHFNVEIENTADEVF